jgi:hypothetical protein
MINFRKASGNFILAYILVTILCYLVSSMAENVFQLPNEKELGVGVFEAPSFVQTVPYHLLINLIVWTLFAWRYLANKINDSHWWRESVLLGLLWLVFALAADFTAFILIKSPFSLTSHQFYIEYQPWITITYSIVIISPLLCYTFLRHSKRNVS